MRTVAFVLLWLYVFTLPWDYILQFGDPIGSAGRVAGLLALAGCVLLIVTNARVRRLRMFHIAVAFYLAIVAASLFWTADPEATLHSVRTYVQSVMVVWLMWELGANRRGLFHLVTAYVAGAYVAALSVFHNFSQTTVPGQAKEARFVADNWNANDTALVLALAIPLAFYVASKRAHWTSTWLARGYLVLAPMAIVLTSSRGGIVVTAVVFSALPLFLRRQTTAAKLATVLVLACGVYLAWNYAPQQSWDRLSTVLTSVRSRDLNGREQVWQIGLHAFGNNYLVGVGAGAFQAGADSENTAHNTFLAILVEQGFLGFSVFSVILAGAIYGTTRVRGEERRMCFFLLLCWAVGAFTLGWAMHRVTWFVLGLVVTFAHSSNGLMPTDAQGQSHRRAGSSGKTEVCQGAAIEMN